MAQLEVIALDTAVPQLRAPGGSDTYLMPKDLTIQGTATVDSGATINGGAVFNEIGADVDFRIESDTNSNAFVLDGGNDNVGIGATANAFVKLRLGGTLPTSSNTSSGAFANGIIPSSTTSDYVGFWSTSSTEAASFTLSNANHFYTSGIAVGAGSTVTNQFGFNVTSGLTGATYNYGFYSNIASGSNRWNFYAAGTANNYFAGNVGIGTSSPGGLLQVGDGTGGITVTFSNSAGVGRLDIPDNFSGGPSLAFGNDTDTGWMRPANNAIATYTNGFERMRIDSSGNVKIGGTADRATTAGTAQLVLFDGTAPVGTLANGVSFYSASGEARVMDAAGNSTLLSPHDQATNEWIFHSKHTPSGKVLRIDVEKMLRFINEHFDLDMVQEWTE